jgi:hypothetical protein
MCYILAAATGAIHPGLWRTWMEIAMAIGLPVDHDQC